MIKTVNQSLTSSKTAPNRASIWLGGGLAQTGAGESFHNPQKTICATSASDVTTALEELDAAVEAGKWVCALFAYELGYVLEQRLRSRLPPARAVPLIWAGVFDTAPSPAPPPAQSPPLSVPGSFTPGIGQDTYLDRIEKILELIRAGDTYQVNFTYPLSCNWNGNARDLFFNLLAVQPVPFPAYFNLGGKNPIEILSLSPELFFQIDKDRIVTRPMKGTAARERLLEADTTAAHALQTDAKNRAENLMIVDLLRNDLSRIAKTGSVKLNSLYKVETYRTLHTLTSEVEATLPSDWRPSQIIEALFPCGSITGAPKIRAMEIINDLEATPRGAYTGAMGVFRPDRSAAFNVSIRTLTYQDDNLCLNVGGGIVADSDPIKESRETTLKAQFASALPNRQQDRNPLQLIETMAWNAADGFAYLNHHMERLRTSASYFQFPHRTQQVIDALEAAVAGQSGPLRVRLVLGADGNPHVSIAPIGQTPDLWRYCISQTPILSTDPYRAHKTSRRAIYDDTYAELTANNPVDEIVFENEHGYLAEGSRTNLFVRKQPGAKLLTPPVADGALPGTLRAHLLETEQAQTARLTRSDLTSAYEAFLGNGLRGLIPAVLVGQAR